MKIHRDQFDKAVTQQIIDAQQAEKLWQFLAVQPGTASFGFTNVLYYLGGMIAIGAMSMFMNLGWEVFGGMGIFVISLLYAAAGVALTESFRKRGYSVPAGICATFVVALTPLAVYGVLQSIGPGYTPTGQAYRDFHRYIEWQWLYMEIATLAVAAVMLWRYRYPFLLMPVAFVLWYMSMDIAQIMYDTAGYTVRSHVSIWFGLLMVLMAFFVDFRSRYSADYAFWLYLFGVMIFWGGLSFQYSDSEWAKFSYAMINVLMIFIGAVLMRRVFVVFGGIGLTSYLIYLSYHVFRDSALFPIMLSLIGFGIIYVGVLWQKNEFRIGLAVRKILPAEAQNYLFRSR